MTYFNTISLSDIVKTQNIIRFNHFYTKL